MYNKIRLLKGETSLTKREMKKFEKGDTIMYRDPIELKKWNADKEEEARKELKEHKCSYDEWQGGVDVEEFALEFYEENEDGEFLNGSDFCFADEYEDKEKKIIQEELERYKEVRATGNINVILAESILKNVICYFCKNENEEFRNEIRDELYNVALDYFIGF